MNKVKLLLENSIGKLKAHKSLYWYSASSLISSVVGMLGGLLIIAWVSPGDLGIWKSAQILQSYVAMLQAGVIHGLNRELPFQIGRGGRGYEKLVSTTQSFAFLVAVLLSLAGVFSWFSSLCFKAKCALSAVFIVSAGGVFVNYLCVTYRAAQLFVKLAKINLIVAGINLLTLLFVYYLKFFGIPLRVVVMIIAQVGLLYFFRPLRASLKFDMESFISLLKVGVPLYASGYIIQLAMTFPNTILLFKEGTKAVGLFAPAMVAFRLMMLLPRSIGQYVYTRMSFRLGQTKDPKALWAYAWKSSVYLLLISIPIIILVTYLAPYIVQRFYPKYVACVDAIFWMLLAGTLFGAQMFANALRSLKAWKWVGIWTGIRAGLSFLLPYAGYKVFVGDSLVGVSVGYASAGVVSFASGLFMAYLATHGESAMLVIGKILSVVSNKK